MSGILFCKEAIGVDSMPIGGRDTEAALRMSTTGTAAIAHQSLFRGVAATNKTIKIEE
jgi:hypothetical protein